MEKNEQLVELAEKIYSSLAENYMCEYDGK